jgi:hypothetical protein
MTTTISADNGVVSGTPGLKYTADSSGILQIQTGTSVTSITIDTRCKWIKYKYRNMELICQ